MLAKLLGHVDSTKGIHVDPSENKTIKNWEAPTKPTEVCQFIGLASYYWRFIENFYKIAKPLTTLTHKDTKFKWEEKQEYAFQTLKHMLCSASIMALTEGIEDFVFYYDASHQGMGCVLM